MRKSKENNKIVKKDIKRGTTVIEFNLSKAVLIIIAIILILSAITTAKIVKDIKKIKIDNNLAFEDVENDNLSVKSENLSYITAYSNVVSLDEESKTRISIVNLFNSQEIPIDDIQLEWIKETNDGGDVLIEQTGENIFLYGKSVGTVNLKARVTYQDITVESNTIEITIEEELPYIYQNITLLKYDAEKLFEIGGSVTDLDKQGIYFTNGGGGDYGYIGSINLNLSDWNVWNSETPKIAYTGLVENQLDSNGNIIFTKTAYGIFDETNTNGKTIYTNVGLPIKSIGNGKYEFKSSEMEVNFENGILQSNTNLNLQEQKNNYIDHVGRECQGFFPFNNNDGENAVYHFGMHTQVPFYMTEDGKSDFDENEDILFEFSGDDDIWIFIDGKLVIDLGGIHDEIAADINFATGEVKTYLGLKSTGQVERTDNLKELLGENWNNDIEEQHKIDIFYLERGLGGSNCSFSFNMPLEIPKSEVIVHHYIDGTDQKLVEDTIIEGNDGELYKTEPSTEIPPMYEVITEKIPGNAIGIIESGKIKEVIYYYKLKEKSTIEKQGTSQITEKTQNIDYEISYKVAVKYYEKEADIEIIDKLPLSIDLSQSNLDNGEYDEETQAIKWTGKYNTETQTLIWNNTNLANNEDVQILTDGNIQITKNLSLKYVEIPIEEGTTIINEIEGTIESEEGLKETVEDNFETTTDFKTKIVVEKQWLGDTENDRPTELTVNLLVGGNQQQEAKLNIENSWSYTFENLNKYNENGENIEYTIQEEVPEGYYLYQSQKTDIDGGEKYILTNYKYGEITFTKVAQEDDSPLSGAEFKLYKFIGTNNSKDELIDTNNITTDWQLVGTCITQNDGLVYFDKLEKMSVYRLVETKAPIERILPKGQWKIEFVIGEYDKNDDKIEIVNGTPIKITGIENPPGIKLADDGKLLIPNLKIFEFPSSGNIGNNVIYQIGICVFTLGIILLIFRKIFLRSIGKVNSKRSN